MYKSIEETTAKLKSLNFVLIFESKKTKNKINIQFNNKTISSRTDISITDIGQKVNIKFSGFIPNDPEQKILCFLLYQNRILSIKNIANFSLQGNQYVEDKTLYDCDQINFNGTLTITFTKHWIEHNILNGAYLENFVNWQYPKFTDEKVFCFGDSWTAGHGVGADETWPNILDAKSFNFGSKGLSHDGICKNVAYVLDKSRHVDTVICLFPHAGRKLLTFECLGKTGHIPIGMQTPWELPIEYKDYVAEARKLIMDKEYITNDWIKSVEKVSEMCKDQNVKCWISTWSDELYNFIPAENKLPSFPSLDTFSDRAKDGKHPHKKHYDLFVKLIKPYIDKN
jgi:hypothetical protein